MAFDSLSVAFEKDGHFHHVELDDTWYSYSVESVFRRFESAGYEIVSAVVHYDEHWGEEMVSRFDKPTYSELIEFYELLSGEIHLTGSILAWIQTNDFRNMSEWDDILKIEGEDNQSIAQEWFGIYYPDLKFPDELVMNWDRTVDMINANNGSTVQYLNGMLYMFC